MKHADVSTLFRIVAGKGDAEAIGHVAACTRCANTVDEMRLALTLAPADAVPQALADSIARRELENELASYSIESPLTEEIFDAKRIATDARYHHPGVVRRLLIESVAARESRPPFALRLTELALLVCGLLMAPEFDEETVHELRASAWREHANALRYLGRYDEASRALDHAMRELDGLLVSAYEEARVEFVRATVLWKQHRFDDALRLAAASRQTFDEHGDRLRVSDCLLLSGAIACEQRQFDEARESFEKALSIAEAANHPRRVACAQNNLGNVDHATGNLSAAAEHFQSAAALFAHLGMTIERARVDWSLGLLGFQLGHEGQALDRLEKASASLRECGSVADAALVGIDVIEHHLQKRDAVAAERALAAIDRSRLPHHAVVALSLLERQIRTASPALLAETRAQLRLVL